MPRYIFLPGHMLPEGTSTIGAPLYQYGCAIMLEETAMESKIDRIKPPLILKCKMAGCKSKAGFIRIVTTWTPVTTKREYVARCKQTHPAVKQVSFICVDCDDFVWRSDVMPRSQKV